MVSKGKAVTPPQPSIALRFLRLSFILCACVALRHSCMLSNHSPTGLEASGPGICSPGFHAMPPGGGGGGAGENFPVTMPVHAESELQAACRASAGTRARGGGLEPMRAVPGKHAVPAAGWRRTSHAARVIFVGFALLPLGYGSGPGTVSAP